MTLHICKTNVPCEILNKYLTGIVCCATSVNYGPHLYLSSHEYDLNNKVIVVKDLSDEDRIYLTLLNSYLIEITPDNVIISRNCLEYIRNIGLIE